PILGVVGPVVLEDLERLPAEEQVGGGEDLGHELLPRRVVTTGEGRRPAAVTEPVGRVLVRRSRRLDDAVQADELLHDDLSHGLTILGFVVTTSRLLSGSSGRPQVVRWWAGWERCATGGNPAQQVGRLS